MNTRRQEPALTFGQFVVRVYNGWGKRRAKGIIRLAVKAHLVEFRGPCRLVII